MNNQTIYPLDFWKWAAELTTSYHYSNGLIEKKNPGRHEYLFDPANLFDPERLEILQSFIYQALEGIIQQGEFNIEYVFDKKICFCWHKGDDFVSTEFYWDEYPTGLIMYIDALYWIWQQSQKK